MIFVQRVTPATCSKNRINADDIQLPESGTGMPACDPKYWIIDSVDINLVREMTAAEKEYYYPTPVVEDPVTPVV